MRAFLTAILLCAAGAAWAGDSPHDRDTLRGLTTIVADVQSDAAAARAGLSGPELQKDVGLRLHLAGIRGLASPDDDTPPKERGVLSISVSVIPLPSDPNVYAYSIVTTLMQGVVMIRDLQTVVAAPTWWVAKNGIGEKAQVRDAVMQSTEKFVSAFLSVNPKK